MRENFVTCMHTLRYRLRESEAKTRIGYLARSRQGSRLALETYHTEYDSHNN